MSDAMHPSRRDFLKGSTAAAAGLALAGGLNFARSAHAAGSEELKVALIGCGGRGRGAAVNCLGACENVKLIAVADAFADKAAGALAMLRKDPAMAAKIDVPPERVFGGFDAYQQAIAAGPDIVILATPPGFRPIHYAAAIEAGKHVFMEKPCCVDAPGFRSLMKTNKLADEKDLKVVVGLMMRYRRDFQEKVKQIHDGAMGEILAIRAYYNCDGIWFIPRNREMTEMEYQMRNWYHFVWLCGDQICEQHVHNLDICNWVKDAHPVKANGMGSCLLRYKNRDPKQGMGQIYDNCCVEFTYDDDSKLFSQCRQMAGTWRQIGEAVHGTKGKWETRWFPLNRPNDGYDQEHVVLVDAIRKNQKHNDGWYGATSSFTGVLGRMAAYSGQEVKWDEAVAKGPDEMPKKFAFDADPPVMPDKDGNYPIPVPGIYNAYAAE